MILGLSNIFFAFLLIGISIPLVRGKIYMNQTYCFRFMKSFESEENWYKINNYGGKQMIIWSILLFFIGIITLFLPIKDNGVITILIACAPLIVLVPAFMSYKYSKKL